MSILLGKKYRAKKRHIERWFIGVSTLIFTILLCLLSFISSVSDERHVLKLLQGAWQCLSEPGVVRVFYANRSYLEYGRAEPYARKPLWRSDYIAAGQFNVQQLQIKIEKSVKSFAARVRPKGSLESRISTLYKIQEITRGLLFLKSLDTRNNSADLLCKKLPTASFTEFVAYIGKKSKEKEWQRQVSLRQSQKLQRLIRRKRRLTHRLNQVLCRPRDVDVLSLLNRLEQVLRIIPGQFSVQMVRQNGDFFNVKMSYTRQQIQGQVIQHLRSGQLTVNRALNYKSNNKFTLNLFLQRKVKLKPCLSLVSLPVSNSWLSYHQQQFSELKSLVKNSSARVLLTQDKTAPETYLLQSLRRIRKRFYYSGRSKHSLTFKRATALQNAVVYKVRHTGSYASVKKLLAQLRNESFFGLVIRVRIYLARHPRVPSSLNQAHKLVHLQLIVKPKTRRELDGLAKNKIIGATLKTPLLNIIRPKKIQAPLYDTNLFY